MDTAISANQSQKTTTSSTPFDEIAQTESKEASRVKTEKDALQSEKIALEKELAESKTVNEEECRASAKKDLIAYSEKELSSILKSANSEADSECSSLETSFNAKKEAAIQELVSKMTDDSFLSTAA